MAHLLKGVYLPIFTNPVARSLGLSKYQLTHDSTAHKLVLDHIMKNHLFHYAVMVMDVTLEPEAFHVTLETDGFNLPKITKCIAPESITLPTTYPRRTLEYIQTAKNITEYPVLATITGPFTIASLVLGFNKTKELLKNDRKTLIHVIEIIYKYQQRYCKDLQDAGVRGFFICEVMAGFITWSECDRFSTKYINKLIDGLPHRPLTVYHNCCRTNNIVRSLQKLNVDAYHFGEATNLENIINKLPPTKLIMGNLSPLDVFLYSDKQHVKIATLRLLEKMKDYKNFQISFGCELPYETNLDCIEAYLEITK